MTYNVFGGTLNLAQLNFTGVRFDFGHQQLNDNVVIIRNFFFY